MTIWIKQLVMKRKNEMSDVSSVRNDIVGVAGVEDSVAVTSTENGGCEFSFFSQHLVSSESLRCFCSRSSFIGAEAFDFIMFSLLRGRVINGSDDNGGADSVRLSQSSLPASEASQMVHFASSNISLALNKCLETYILPFQCDISNETGFGLVKNSSCSSCKECDSAFSQQRASPIQTSEAMSNLKEANTMVRMLGMIQDVYDSPLLFHSSYEHFISDACGFDTNDNQKGSRTSTPFFEVEQCYIIPIPGSSYLFWEGDDKNDDNDCADYEKSMVHQQIKMKRLTRLREDQNNYDYVTRLTHNQENVVGYANIRKEIMEENGETISFLGKSIKKGRVLERKENENGEYDNMTNGDILLKNEHENVVSSEQREDNINNNQNIPIYRSDSHHIQSRTNEIDFHKKSHTMFMSPNHPRDGTGGLLNFPCASSSQGLSQAAIVTFLSDRPLELQKSTDGGNSLKVKDQYGIYTFPVGTGISSVSSGLSSTSISQPLRPNMIVECFGFIVSDSPSSGITVETNYPTEEEDGLLMMTDATARFEKLPSALVKKFICLGYRIVKSPLDLFTDTSAHTSVTEAVTECHSSQNPPISMHPTRPFNLQTGTDTPIDDGGGKEKKEDGKCFEAHSTSHCFRVSSLSSLALVLYQGALELFDNYEGFGSFSSTTADPIDTRISPYKFRSAPTEVKHYHTEYTQWEYYQAFLRCILTATSDNRTSVIAHARKIVIQYLTNYVLNGDVLGAEYLLLHLLSVVDFKHADSVPVGDVPLRFLLPLTFTQGGSVSNTDENTIRNCERGAVSVLDTSSCNLSCCCSPAALEHSSSADNISENYQVIHQPGDFQSVSHNVEVRSSVLGPSSGMSNSHDHLTSAQLITTKLRRIVSFGTSYIDLSQGLFHQPSGENVSNCVISKDPSLMPHKDMQGNYIATGPLQLPSDGHHLTIIIPVELHVEELNKVNTESAAGQGGRMGQWDGWGAPTTLIPTITPTVQDELLQLIHKQTTYIAYPFGNVTIPTDARVLVVQPLAGSPEVVSGVNSDIIDNYNDNDNMLEQAPETGKKCIPFLSREEKDRITCYSKELEKRTPPPLRVACTLVLETPIKEKPGAGELLVGSDFNGEKPTDKNLQQQQHLKVVEALCRAYFDVMRRALPLPDTGSATSTLIENENPIINQLRKKIENEYRHYANIHQETLFRELTSWQQSNRIQFNSDSLVHNNTLHMIMSLTKVMRRSNGTSPYVSVHHQMMSTPELFAGYVLAKKKKEEIQSPLVLTREPSEDKNEGTSTGTNPSTNLFNPDNYIAEIKSYFSEELEDFYKVKKLEQRRFERNLRYMYIPTEGCA